MSLKITSLRNPHFNAFYFTPKEERCYQVEKTKTTARKTLQNTALTRVHYYMSAKTIFNIKSSQEIKEFIKQITSILKQKQLLTEINKLKTLSKELSEMYYHDVNIIRLATVNPSNPIINSLKSLNKQTIDELKRIPPPPFFLNFFQELEFQANIEEMKKSRDPIKGVEQLIDFSKILTEKKEHSRALQALKAAKKNTQKKVLKFHRKINFFREIAQAFSHTGDRKKMTETLIEGIECLSEDSPTHEHQIKYFKEISLDLIDLNAWDLLAELFTLFTKSPHLEKKERIKAFNQVFQYIFDAHGLEKGFPILLQVKDCIEKDLLIEQLADIASNQPDWMNDAVQMAQHIKNPKIKDRTFDMLSEKQAAVEAQEVEA